MKDIVSKTINIDAHSTKDFAYGTKHEILDGKTKYSFFETKADGTETRAWQQWQEFELKKGLKVRAGVKEEEKEYNGHPYVQRTIMFFESGDEHGTVYAEENKLPLPDTKLEERVKDLEDRVFIIEGELLNRSESKEVKF